MAVDLPGQLAQLGAHRVHEARDEVPLPQRQELLQGLGLCVGMVVGEEGLS